MCINGEINSCTATGDKGSLNSPTYVQISRCRRSRRQVDKNGQSSIDGIVGWVCSSRQRQSYAAPATLAYDPEVERQRLALQEQELQFRREQLAVEEQHRKEELEEKRRQEELEEIIRRQQWEREDQIRRVEQEREDRKCIEDAELEKARIRLSSEQNDLRHQEEVDERRRQEIQRNRSVNKAKLYGNALKASMNIMPDMSGNGRK